MAGLMCADRRFICAPGSSSVVPTEREAQCAELLSMGYSYKQVARLLGLSYTMVSTHVYDLAHKIPGDGTPQLKVAVWWLTKRT